MVDSLLWCDIPLTLSCGRSYRSSYGMAVGVLRTRDMQAAKVLVEKSFGNFMRRKRLGPAQVRPALRYLCHVSPIHALGGESCRECPLSLEHTTRRILSNDFMKLSIMFAARVGLLQGFGVGRLRGGVCVYVHAWPAYFL